MAAYHQIYIKIALYINEIRIINTKRYSDSIWKTYSSSNLHQSISDTLLLPHLVQLP